VLAKLRSHIRHNVVGYLALFVALGGTTYAATGGNFILGRANTADAPTSLSSGATGPALRLTNTSTGAGARALGLNVAAGHAPFSVNSGAKVTNLNADKLDGMDSTSFVSSSKLQRVGPVEVTPLDGNSLVVEIATIGHFSFKGECNRGGGNDRVTVTINTDVDHSTYASMTQPGAGAQFGFGDMSAGNVYTVALADSPPGGGDFNPMSGSALGPDGQQVIFDLYQGQNARNQIGQCVFGGTFVLK
jgi:hypothetical protein